LSLSKQSVDPAHRGRRDWAKWDVLKLAHLKKVSKTEIGAVWRFIKVVGS
jgi:hypothetical protein